VVGRVCGGDNRAGTKTSINKIMEPHKTKRTCTTTENIKGQSKRSWDRRQWIKDYGGLKHATERRNLKSEQSSLKRKVFMIIPLSGRKTGKRKVGNRRMRRKWG